MGLDNSGKTSIILSLKKNTNLLSYLSLKPTPGLKIETVEDEDNKFYMWDFGGQERYRNSYLQQFESYLTKVNKIIFVIDVQDDKRFDLALSYLKDIIERLIDAKHIEFSIFLHKCDPNIYYLDKSIDEKIMILTDRLNEILKPNHNYKIFKSSIYTCFDKLLIAEEKKS